MPDLVLGLLGSAVLTAPALHKVLRVRLLRGTLCNEPKPVSPITASLPKASLWRWDQRKRSLLHVLSMTSLL